MALERDDDSGGGQVSEVGGLDPDDAQTPISDSQGVAGNPENEDESLDADPAATNA